MLIFESEDAATQSTDLDVLKMIRAAWAATLRAHGNAIDVPPYLLTFDSASDLVWINYATPIVDASDGCMVGALALIRQQFEERRRVLRFEFFDALVPGLGPLLERAGLALQVRMPAMACTAAELSHETAKHEVVMLSANSTDEEIAAFIATRNAAFGPISAAPLADQIVEQRREWTAGTARSVLAYRNGQPAGVATRSGAGDVAELVGVGTAPEHRGHGIARATSEALVRDHLVERGGKAVWLSAGSDTARDVYARIGFRFIGWQSNYVDREWLKSQQAFKGD